MTTNALDLSFGKKRKLFADVCIVGTGAAGIPLALDLAKFGLDVIMLESSQPKGGPSMGDETNSLGYPCNLFNNGEDYCDPCAQPLYEGTKSGTGFTEGDCTDKSPTTNIIGFPNNTNFLVQSRRRFYGGSTNCWGSWCRPLIPYVFNKREGINPDGWPISYADLFPYYRKASTLCQLGPFHFDDPSFWTTYKHFQNPNTKVALLPFKGKDIRNVNWQTTPYPFKFQEIFGDDLKNNVHIKVIRNANVLEINTDKKGRKATSLKVGMLLPAPLCSSKNKTAVAGYFEVEASQFVIAAGGIESIRLLLLSDKVNKKGLGNSSGFLGKYFCTHPVYNKAAKVTSAKPFPEGVQNFFNQVELSSGGFVFSAIEPTPTYLKKNKAALWRTILKTFETQSVKGAKDKYTAIVNLNWEQIPNSNSQITLGKKTDVFGQRKVNLDYVLTKADKKTVKQALDLTKAGLEKLGYVESWENLVDTDTSTNCWTDTLFVNQHHMGATRMSADKSKGVVDADLCLHDVNNVYICSSSVFPAMGISNPTLTIIALALRLSDHLCWKSEAGFA